MMSETNLSAIVEPGTVILTRRSSRAGVSTWGLWTVQRRTKTRIYVEAVRDETAPDKHLGDFGLSMYSESGSYVRPGDIYMVNASPSVAKECRRIEEEYEQAVWMMRDGRNQHIKNVLAGRERFENFPPNVRPSRDDD